ncbi:MAG: methyltransferase [Desulfurococcales archaeon]|nr:methyltransferase [Desulfurococcales archaeon]
MENCVYEPSDDTFLAIEGLKKAIEYATQGKHSTVLDIVDIGSGTGLISKDALEIAPDIRIVSVDISPYAVEATRGTLNIPQEPRALVVQCDAGKCVWRADIAVFNPPYLPPSPEDSLLEGLCNGWYLKSLVNPEAMARMCLEASRIAPIVVAVYSSLSPVDILKCLRGRGYEVIATLKKKLFFEDLYSIVAVRR